MFKSETLAFGIDEKGIARNFLYLPDGIELIDRRAKRPFASARIGGETVRPDSAVCGDKTITLTFSGESAAIGVEIAEECLIFRVKSCSDGIEKLDFAGMSFSRNAKIAATGLALNLNTDALGLPGDSAEICAYGFRELGIAGCAFAVTAAPRDKLSEVLRAITEKYTEGIPFSRTGGAFAAENRAVRGSYVFNTDGMTEENVGDWISLCRALGAEQIDFHGGHSFRFGDCEPNREIFPEGKASFKKVIDALHAAGIRAGLHAYAHFIDPSSYLVTPVPDRGLAAAHLFTLRNGVGAEDHELFFNEDTAELHTITGFFVRNSVLLAIDDEIIRFSAVKKDAPFGVSGCERGALGTKASPHSAGAEVRHLKSCFGLLAPDQNSPLFTRVAELTAAMYDDCGFDMMYMDALDGDDIFAGGEFSWHYGSKFVFEVVRRVKKPPILEMSTMHHHLWYVRSRLGAWDCPTRAHKIFLDSHNASNIAMKNASLLPQNIGWWVYGKTDENDISLATRMFSDDYAYLCRLSLVNDWSLAYLRMSPEEYKKSAELRKIAAQIRGYEALRLQNSVPEETKKKLAESECILKNGEFYPVKYINKTAVPGERFTVHNPYREQTPFVRIENLARKNRAAKGKLIFDPERDFDKLRVIVSKNVRAEIAKADGRLIFSAEQLSAGAGYARIELKYEGEDLDMSGLHVLNVTVAGDGNGEVVDFQLKSPKHLISGFCDRLVDVDFSGEREFTLIENDAARMGENLWPFSGGGHYTAGPDAEVFDIPNESGTYNEYEWYDSMKDAGIYQVAREKLVLSRVHSLSVWINNMVPGKKYKIALGKIKAFPAVKNRAAEIGIMSGGSALTLSGIPALGYAETGIEEACCFANDGKSARTEFSGALRLKTGENTVEITCKDPRARLKLTFGFIGEKL